MLPWPSAAVVESLISQMRNDSNEGGGATNVWQMSGLEFEKPESMLLTITY